MKEKSAEKKQVRVMILPEYGKQKLLAYADSFRDLADVFTEAPSKDVTVPFLEEELDRSAYLYERKLSENREMMAEHLSEMAQIMTDAAKVSFSYEPLPERKYKKVVHALRQEGIGLKEIYYIHNLDGHMEIGASLCAEKGKERTGAEAADMLSVLFEKRLVVSRETDYYLDQKYRDFYFREEPGYSILTGAAKAVKEGETVSGDNVTTFETDNGSFYVLMSDGMGSGEKACADSSRVLDLTERLFAAGFSGATAVGMINSSLTLSSGDANMSTLDITRFDLYEGSCELTKVGAAGTFIKRDNMVEQISSRNLPLGVFGRLEPEIVNRKLMDGDYVIMVSDGIIDGLSLGVGEEALSEIISRLDIRNPKEMANQILNYVIHQSRGNIRDDMTVVVTGIWENT